MKSLNFQINIHSFSFRCQVFSVQTQGITGRFVLCVYRKDRWSVCCPIFSGRTVYHVRCVYTYRLRIGKLKSTYVLKEIL